MTYRKKENGWIVRIALTALVGEMLAFSILGAGEVHGDDSRVESVQSVVSETVNSGAESVNSGAETVNSGAETVNSGAESVSSEAESVNSGAESVSSEAETVNSGAESVSSEAESVNSGAESVNSGTDLSNSDSQKTAASMSYTVFKSLPPEQKKQAFAQMTGPEIYNLVKSSDENWPVTSYDLITPENAKETIILYDNHGDLHFNLAWPPYGGFMPESIASIGELSGTLDVSRDGGDGGHSMSYGRNEDGSYPNDSQRSVPKSSATVRTGILDVDRSLQVLDIVTNGESEDSRLSELRKLGYNSETASQFLKDNTEFPSRDEISGPNNINDGAKSVGNTVDGKYGYYGITAPWVAGDLKLEGGAGQLCTVFSWGTLCTSGLIHDTGTAEIH